jgi:hypothetical protein
VREEEGGRKRKEEEGREEEGREEEGRRREVAEEGVEVVAVR